MALISAKDDRRKGSDTVTFCRIFDFDFHMHLVGGLEHSLFPHILGIIIPVD